MFFEMLSLHSILRPWTQKVMRIPKCSPSCDFCDYIHYNYLGVSSSFFAYSLLNTAIGFVTRSSSGILWSKHYFWRVWSLEQMFLFVFGLRFYGVLEVPSDLLRSWDNLSQDVIHRWFQWIHFLFLLAYWSISRNLSEIKGLGIIGIFHPYLTLVSDCLVAYRKH